jgi:hypothetical protein
LAQAFSAERIQEKIEFHDWLLRHNPNQLSRNSAGWLVRAIEEDYSAPLSSQFKSKAQQAREAEEQARRLREINAELEMEHNEAREPVYPSLDDPRADSITKYKVSPDLLKIWDQTLSELRLVMDRGVFDLWLPRSLLLEVKDGVARIGVHNTYAQQWLQHRLCKVVKYSLVTYLKQDVELKFEVMDEESDIEVAQRKVREAGEILKRKHQEG